MGSSSFLKALAKDKEDKGVDERGARTSSGNEPLHYREAANESKAGVSPASSVRSQGQNLELVRNTGLVTQMKEALPKIKATLFNRNKTEVPNTNLFRNLTVEKNERGFADEINDHLQLNREKRAAAIAEYQEAQRKAERQGLNGIEALWAAGASQREEQKNQKSSSFMAGLLNSTGGNAAKIAAKIAQKTGNEDVAKYWNKQTDWLEELQNANKGYGTAGAIAGEFAKAGAGYATIGKAAEKTAQKAAEKGLAVAGKKMAVSTASDTAQKIAAGLTLGGREAKIAKTAAGLLGQQAADTVVNTPITIAAGLAEDKDKKEILKDIGKQEATDAAFNVGLEALGAGAKAVGKKVEKAKETKAAKRTERLISEMEQAAKAELPEAAAKQKGKAVMTPGEETVKEKMKEIPARAEEQMLEGADLSELAREKQIGEAAEAMKENKNVLAKSLSRKERKALELELAQLDDAEYKMAQLRKIYEETNGDTAAVTRASNQFDTRKAEIKKILTEQEAIRTKTDIRKDAGEEIIGALGIQKKSQQRKVHTALSKIEEAVNDGTYTKEMGDQLFDKLFKIKGGEGSDTAKLRKLRNKLQNTTVHVDVKTAADVDVYGWQRKPKGLAKVKHGGVNGNVETLYAEFSKDFPEYFPKSITQPAEQAEQIRMVAEKMADGIGFSRNDYKKGFDRALQNMFDDLGVHQVYGEKMAESMQGVRKNLMGGMDYSRISEDEVKEWHDELYRLQQNAENLPNELTNFENMLLEGFLQGEYSEEQVKKLAGPRYSMVKQKYDATKPVRELENQINGWNSYVHDTRNKAVADAVGEIKIGEGGWNDKVVAAAYAREQQERILYDIIDDKKTADRVKETFFTPIHENERDRTLLVRSYKKRIKDTGVSTKKNIDLKLPGTKKLMTSESGIVQWLGEHEHDLRQMQASGAPEESWREAAEEIAFVRSKLSSKQLERIDKCISEFQSIYKEIHEMINRVLVRNGYDPIGYIDGYFPHMQFDEPEGVFQKVADLLGFRFFKTEELPMEISGRTEDFRPGKRWSANMLERKGAATDYDALRGFDRYIDSVSDVIYHTDDIQRLRSLEEYLRYNASNEGIKTKIDEIRSNKKLTAEGKAAAIKELYEAGSTTNRLQNYVNNLTEYTNILAGKKSSMDRAFEKTVLGRKFYQAIDELESKVGGNMTAGNIGSAMTNFIPMTQALGSMKATNSMKGLKEALVYMGKSEMDELTKKSAFLATRSGDEKLFEGWLDKLQNAGGKLNPLQWMEAVDTFSTQAVWRGKYYDNLEKGMAEETAIKNADEYARGLFGGRSKGAMPTIMNVKNPIVKPFTMFQLEVNNQLSHILKDIPREEQGNAQKIFKRWFCMAMGAYVFNDVYEELTGRRSALDPFGIANEAVGDLTGEKLRNTVDIIVDAANGEGIQLTEETEKKKPSAAIENAMEEIGGQMPFVGGLLFDGGRIPVQSAIPNLTTMVGAKADWKAAESDEEAAEAKATFFGELEKPLWYLGMPVAGGQIRKTVKGAKMMMDGGSYSQTSKGKKLQFAVDQDNKADWAKALLFGKWATDEGKAYMEKKQTLSESQTETYEELRRAGVKNTTAFETINEIKAAEKSAEKRNAIRSAPLTSEQKAILYQANTSNEYDQKILSKYRTEDSFGDVAECLMKIADCENATARRNAIARAILSEEDKEYIYLNKVAGADSKEKEKSKIIKLRKVGVSMKQYLKVRSIYGDLYNADLKNDEKQLKMIREMYNAGLSTAQQAKVKELFKFGGGYTSEWKY